MFCIFLNLCPEKKDVSPVWWFFYIPQCQSIFHCLKNFVGCLPFFFSCCQGGQLDTMLACSCITHFHMLYVRLADRHAVASSDGGDGRWHFVKTNGRLIPVINGCYGIPRCPFCTLLLFACICVYCDKFWLGYFIFTHYIFCHCCNVCSRRLFHSFVPFKTCFDSWLRLCLTWRIIIMSDNVCVTWTVAGTRGPSGLLSRYQRVVSSARNMLCFVH